MSDEMKIGISMEAVEINTIAGCLMDLAAKPEMTYGGKAKVIYDLEQSFNHTRRTLDELKVDCEGLLDQCRALLDKAYEESYGKGYRKPLFRIVLTPEEIRALRSHIANLPPARKHFIGIDNRTLFGHELEEQRRTPYLVTIIG